MRYLGRVVIGGSKWPLRGSHRQKWRADRGQGGRHRRHGDGRRRRASSDVAMRARVGGHRRRHWCHRRQWRCCSSTCAARSSRHRRMRRCSSGRKNRLGVSGAANLQCGSGRKKPRRRSGRKTARPDVQLGHFKPDFRLIRYERPAVGAARSAVAFLDVLLLTGAAARRAALLQS